MVEVRLLAPYQDHAADAVIDVSVEEAESLRAAGKASLITAEKASEEAAAQGHYTDVTGREDVAPLSPGAPQPGPQEETGDDDDDPPKRSKKK